MCVNKNKQAGFTLIELLVTMILFAVIAVLSYTALNTSIKQQNAQKIHHQQLLELQKTLLYLERDITQVHSQTMTLNAQGFTLSSVQNEQLFKLHYSIHQKKLIRQNKTDAENTTSLTLINNISNGKIRILDSDNKWHTEWGGTGKSYYPRAIEIKFKHPAWGEIKKLVFINE